jgi:serine/threonine protein kinase
MAVEHSLPPSALRQVEQICDRLEDDLRAGRIRPLDEYCAGVTEPTLSALKRELQALVAHYNSSRATRSAAGGDASLNLPGTANAFAQTDALVGHLLGTYRIEARVGSGGMGQVYRAADTRLPGRVVAIKVLPPEHGTPAAVERFRREGAVALRLHHDHVVRCFEWGEDAGRYYIVMEWVDGMTLADYIERKGRLSVTETARIGQAVARALAHAAGHGVVHRDIKPANILMTRDGRIKLADLGLARFFARSVSGRPLTVTHAGMLLGTIDYMAPEQADDPTRVDARSDIYALGCTLYHCLAGRAPFAGSIVSKLKAHQDQPPPPLVDLNPGVPAQFAALIESRMLAKLPQERFPTAHEVEAAMKPWSRKAPDAAAVPEAKAAAPAASATLLQTKAVEPTRGPTAPTVTGTSPVVAPPSPLAANRAWRHSMSSRRRQSPWGVAAVAVGLVLLSATSVAIWLGGNEKENYSAVVKNKPVLPGNVQIQEAAADFRPIFSGTDLTGFVVDSGDMESWRVDNGELVVAGGKKGWLLSEASFTDFILRFEFQPGAGSNSGVALRAAPIKTTAPEAAAVPYGHHLEVQIVDDDSFANSPALTGALYWAKARPPLPPDERAVLKPAPAWNQMEISLQRRSLRVVVNGRQVRFTDLDKLAGNAALFGVAQPSGRIGFQSHTGTMRFRNVEIQELASPPASQPPVDDDDGWAQLFNGQDLSGWETQSKRIESWRVNPNEQSLVCSSVERTADWLWTERPFGDFELSFDFKITAHTNSGIAIWADPSKYFNLLEIQIRDDADPPARHTTGSLIFTISDSVEPHTPAKLRPLGEWNSMTIHADGVMVHVGVNGGGVGSYDLSKIDPNTASPKARSMAANNLKRRSGVIGLNLQQGEVRYRNIRARTFTVKSFAVK